MFILHKKCSQFLTMNFLQREVTVNTEQELLVYRKNNVEIKYRVFQIYGQKYIKKLESFISPDNWSEIYVSNIPRDMPIEDIFMFFIQCGEIYQLRLLMDFSGFNRGHCFVQYQDVTHSRAAICCLNDEEISPGYKLTIKLSLNNNQLIIRSLPTLLSENYVKEKVQELIGEGLINVTMKPSRISTRNYCFCTYQDHQFAVMAHKKVWPSINIGGHVAEVHWAVPELLRFGINLYFTNCPYNMTKQEFFSVLRSKIDIKSVIQFRVSESFGFITFANRMYLMHAEAVLKDVTIRGRKLMVSRTPFANQPQEGDGECSQYGDNDSLAQLLSLNANNTNQSYYSAYPAFLGPLQPLMNRSIVQQQSYYAARQVPYSYPIQQSARTQTQYGAVSIAQSNTLRAVPMSTIKPYGNSSCASVTVTVNQMIYQNNYPTYSLFPRQGERSSLFTTPATHTAATSNTISTPSNMITSFTAQNNLEAFWKNAYNNDGSKR